MLLLFVVLFYFLLEIRCGGEKVMVCGMGDTGLHSPSPGKCFCPRPSWIMDIQRGPRENVEMKCPRPIGWSLEQCGVVESVPAQGMEQDAL